MTQYWRGDVRCRVLALVVVLVGVLMPSLVLADGASIQVTKTVGTAPGCPQANHSLTVPPGTPVTYCYEVTNTGGDSLTVHTLTDDVLGEIGGNQTLGPGQSLTLSKTVTAGTSVTNTASITATVGTSTDVVTGSDVANLKVTPVAPVASSTGLVIISILLAAAGMVQLMRRRGTH